MYGYVCALSHVLRPYTIVKFDFLLIKIHLNRLCGTENLFTQRAHAHSTLHAIAIIIPLGAAVGVGRRAAIAPTN